MLSSKLIRLFLDMRTNDLLPQADLLLEMLDAQDTFDLPSSMDTNVLSSCPVNFSQNSLTNNNNNIISTPFTTDSPSIYPEQYSNISAIEMDNDISDLSGKHSSSTPSHSFYKRTQSEPTTLNGHFIVNNSSY
jgi:hypothetical protein